MVLSLLERIALFFGVGKVYADRSSSCQYIVQSISGLEVIVKHLESYPLITQKRADFELFRQASVRVLPPSATRALASILFSFSEGAFN